MSGERPRVARVTGALQFTDDLLPAGTLHGAFVRLPEARARIERIDTAAAAAAQGVVAVVTAADFGEGGPPRFGPVVRDQPVLAAECTRYVGEPVALVVARTRAEAVAGARLVRVRRTSLPGWHTVADAEAAEPLHDGGSPALSSGPDAPNVMGSWQYGWGSVQKTREQAAVVVENRYTAPFAHHFPIETWAAVGIPDGDSITVWDTVQHPFQERRVLAEMLHLPLSAVRVRAINMGGSFGGKGYPKLGPVVAVVARMLNRPLKIALSSEEAFLTGQREAAEIWIRTGFAVDGTLLSQEVRADFLIGAYTDISTRVVSKSALHACGPYRTPAAAIHARGVYTTTPPTTAFRGFGAAHLVLALEGQIDEAADRLGIDPVQLRLHNMKKRGEPTVEGETPVDGDWPEIVRIAADKLGWGEPVTPGRGRGLSFGMKSCVPGTTSSARLRLSADGSVTAYVGTSEMGQGAVLTYMGLVADGLGLPLDRVTVEMADTELVPFDALTASSRSLVHVGNALQAALADVQRQVADLAAETLGLTVEKVSVEGAKVTTPEWSGTLVDVLDGAFGRGQGEIVGTGRFTAPSDPEHPIGGPTPFFEAVVTGVDLSVDPDTGIIDVHRVVHVTDAGRVLNLPRAVGLDEGGVVMGMGLALSEGLVYGDDGLANGSSLDYRIPTVWDIPRESVSEFQENRDGPGPLGSKGLAEGGVLAVAPALAAALHQATGRRFRDLPFTAEKIWRACREDEPAYSR